MSKHDKSPIKFVTPNFGALGASMAAGMANNTSMAVTDRRMFGGGIEGLAKYVASRRNNQIGAEAPPPPPAAPPIPNATDANIGGNPFEGRTFTISPAQMNNVQNVFGDTNERQASVGEYIEQNDENFDTGPLFNKCYKK